MKVVPTVIFFVAVQVLSTQALAVNISNSWFLPEEGFPVFYRYFRDRITWTEADAVCQFHHGNLVTVSSSSEFDATRAYLKDIGSTDIVWIGLMKRKPEEKFVWTKTQSLLNPDDSHWQEQIPKTDSPLCAAVDPAADFRWFSLGCGGPEVAAFICELPVPDWAQDKENGCMLMSLPSHTVTTYLPDEATIVLTSDCGLNGTRIVNCKGHSDHEEMINHLSCEVDDEEMVTSVSSSTPTADYTEDETREPATRHRRDTENIPSLVTEMLMRTTAMDQIDTSSPVGILTTSQELDTRSTITEKSTTEEVVKSYEDDTSGQLLPRPPIVSLRQPKKTDDKVKGSKKPIEAIERQNGDKKGPIFNHPGMSNPLVISTEKTTEVATTTTSTTPEITSTQIRIATVKGIEQMSAELFESDICDVALSLNTSEANSSRPCQQFATTTNSAVSSTSMMEENIRTVAPILSTDTVTSSSTKNNLTEDNGNQDKKEVKVEKEIRRFLPAQLRNSPPIFSKTTQQPIEWQTEEVETESENTEVTEVEPEAPPRPKRGRQLTRSYRRSFYPYFFNRVLG